MEKIQVDALIVGGGISGMQSALDLADQGYQVAMVEKEPSIGGKMIALSKVFPTLDCCSCITTPKMSAVAHHSNIQLFTYCEVQSLSLLCFWSGVLRVLPWINSGLPAPE